MEIKKNYELRQFGNKVVLIGFSLTPCLCGTECKMHVLLEADELVEHSQHRLSANDFFFLMRVGEKFVICRDINNQMYVSPPFKEYTIVNKDILFFENIWWRWTPTAQEIKEPLGYKPLENFYELFIDDSNYPKNPLILNYYEDGNLQKMNFNSFVRYAYRFEGSNLLERTHYDVMRIIDERGKPFWISITPKAGPSYCLGGRLTEREITYHFSFSPTPHNT